MPKVDVKRCAVNDGWRRKATVVAGPHKIPCNYSVETPLAFSPYFRSGVFPL